MAKSSSKNLSYRVLQTSVFERVLKKFSKGNPNLADSVRQALSPLKEGILPGVLVGKNIYKLRVPKNDRGKSGGYRLGYYVKSEQRTVYLLSIIDKKDEANFEKNKLEALVKKLHL